MTLVTLAEATVPGPVRDRADLARWIGRDRHVVGRAIGQQRGERERAVGADAQVVAAVVLQDHRARQPRNGAADRVACPRTSPPDQLPAVAAPLAMMPGAPPVKVPSVAVISTTPFSENAGVRADRRQTATGSPPPAGRN